MTDIMTPEQAVEEMRKDPTYAIAIAGMFLWNVQAINRLVEADPTLVVPDDLKEFILLTTKFADDWV